MQQLRDRILGLRTSLLGGGHEDGLAFVLSAFVGLATGLLAVALIEVVRFVQTVAFGPSATGWRVVVVPVVGAFVVGLLIRYWIPESRGGGIVRTMQTIALYGGRFRVRTPLSAVVASGLALGTGASGGREGPIVLIGGSVGSLLGRFFALGEERMRTLVAAGAAAGIGASFNAPIGGMMFAIELIIGGFRSGSLQAVVVASVVGSVTARQIIGQEIIYQPSQVYNWVQLNELALFIVVGVVAAGFGLGFIYGVDVVGRGFNALGLWFPLRLALGGLGVGLIALWIPEVLGTGSDLPPINGVTDPIQRMLDGDISRTGLAAAAALFVLAIAKLVATCLSIGSGNAVGYFAPTIFCGAAAGGSLGFLAEVVFPTLPIEPGAFALVGMAAVFSAAARAPLTAILIVFEITNSYELLLPLMIATGIAVLIAENIQRESVFTLPLRRMGIVYSEPEDVDIMQTVRVGEIMTDDPHTVPPDMTLADLQHDLHRTRSHGFPVTDGDRLIGVVTITDLARATGRPVEAVLEGKVGNTELTVGEICTRGPSTVTPGDPVFRALRRMASLDVGRLPVVSQEDHSRLVGVLRRVDLVKGYQRAITRSTGAQQRRQRSQLRDLVGAAFIEFEVGQGAPAAGKAVRDIGWPRSTVLTALRRDGEVIMPNGDTVVRPGDEVVVLADREESGGVRDLLAAPEAEGQQGPV